MIICRLYSHMFLRLLLFPIYHDEILSSQFHSIVTKCLWSRLISHEFQQRNLQSELFFFFFFIMNRTEKISFYDFRWKKKKYKKVMRGTTSSHNSVSFHCKWLVYADKYNAEKLYARPRMPKDGDDTYNIVERRQFMKTIKIAPYSTCRCCHDLPEAPGISWSIC